MVKWSAFSNRFFQKEQWAFENMAYFLFCSEYNCPIGIFRYKDQPGIETEPIEIDGVLYGFQAKYINSISSEKRDIIDSIKKAKDYHPQLNKLVLYVNQELSKNKKTKEKPQYQLDIEKTALDSDVVIEWRVPSHIEYQLLQTKNKWIYEIFFGKKIMEPSFFEDNVVQNINNLGPRYNEELNLELPIAKLFDAVAHSKDFYDRLLYIIDSWLTKGTYLKFYSNKDISSIEDSVMSIRSKMLQWVNNNDYSIGKAIKLTSIITEIKNLNGIIYDKQCELYRQSSAVRNDEVLYRLREVVETNSIFLEEYKKLHVELCNNPVLVITGEAGCGKSHLLGDIANKRNKQALPTLLLLGTTFKDPSTIEKNILTQLGLNISFSDFIEQLNEIGMSLGSRVLILIDAINEGSGANLWRDQISGFIEKISKYPAVGLVLTIRSTYYSDIIPDDYKNKTNITIYEHPGFKGNIYEALKLFCKYYDIQQPSFPLLNPEFSNPLFLQIVCNSVSKSENKAFPHGFTGLFGLVNRYEKYLNKKFEERREVYKNRRIVSKALEYLAVKLCESPYGSLRCDDILNLFDKKFPLFPNLLSDLLEEGVLIKMKSLDEEIISFSFQRIGDFVLAKELTGQYKSFEEFTSYISCHSIAKSRRWHYEGVCEALAIVIPERFDCEFFELLGLLNEKEYPIDWFVEKTLEGLKWRDVASINDKKISEWLIKNENHIDFDSYLYFLTEVSSIPNHPFNSDRLTQLLFSYTMAERDSFWQQFIYSYGEYDDGGNMRPLARLIDWAWSNHISNADQDVIRLTAQTLAWILASTDNKLRDCTTKALVNLLVNYSDILIRLLNVFKDVNDPYIAERLYAVAYGCILRTNNIEAIKSIGQYVYDAVFKDGTPPVHVLLRDYARNIVEYAIYRNLVNVDVSKIRPPYKTYFEYSPLSNEQLDMKYKPKGEDGYHGNKDWGITAIMSSMVTEYGRGVGGYGDFGRYTFQAALSHFVLPIKYNVDSLSNLAVEWIFERYGYKSELHGYYDRLMDMGPYTRAARRIERIGKKYQWIALHEMTARVSDHFSYRNGWGDDAIVGQYQGPWQNYLRNIDPAYITPYKEKEGCGWWTESDYTNWDMPDENWTNSLDDLNPITTIKKQDENGDNWIKLAYCEIVQEPKMQFSESIVGRKKQIQYLIQAYIIKKEDKEKIINFLKDKSFWGRWMPEKYEDTSSLINREKFWSPAYMELCDDTDEWQIIDGTNYKVIVACEPAKGPIEGDQSGTNNTYMIPCRIIFNEMELRYSDIDGELVNSQDKRISIHNDSETCMIREDDLLDFLQDNEFDIFWTVLIEKNAYCLDGSLEQYFKVPCGVFYYEKGNIVGELNLYDRD